MNWEEMYDVLRYEVGVSKEALELAFGICGCSEETGKRILYYTTGMNSFEDFLENED